MSYWPRGIADRDGESRGKYHASLRYVACLYGYPVFGGVSERGRRKNDGS